VDGYSQRIGARIRRAREAKGWSQLDLANAVAERGGPRYSSRISIWETGRSLPSEEHRRILADALDVPIEHFYAWSADDD
jgi:transcriptional regulator with XRE-family HTH domain